MCLLVRQVSFYAHIPRLPLSDTPRRWYTEKEIGALLKRATELQEEKTGLRLGVAEIGGEAVFVRPSQ